MKIFYCAVFDNEGKSADNSKHRELESLGHDVVAYNYRNRGLQLEGNPFQSPKRDDEIITFCKNWNPDFIIFAKCDGINIKVFEELKKIAPLCYWFADPLVTYSNPEFYEKTQKANFFICDKKNVLEKALTLNRNSFLNTDGFDRMLEVPKEVEEEYDVSFIGNLYGDRKEKFEKISHKVTVIGNAFGPNHSLEVSKSKINLNFCTTSGQSDRVFKVLAAGGFLLTDDWPDRDEFFTDGEDLVVFKDIDDLNSKISFYLNNEAERKRIAKNGNKTVKNYTRQQWAINVLRIKDELKLFSKTTKKTKENILLAGPWVGACGS